MAVALVRSIHYAYWRQLIDRTSEPPEKHEPLGLMVNWSLLTRALNSKEQACFNERDAM
jgi:hypothetical protein